MWKFENKLIDDINKCPIDAIGFIYKITNVGTGKFYIGKKNLFTTRNKPLGKKEIAALTDKRKSKKKTIIKESEWLQYNGNSTNLLDDIKAGITIKKEILEFCSTERELTYREAYHLIINDVLNKNVNCYNLNILGRFFK